ncbi:hypothetical protein C8R48DRAFT_723482 [Suillus tomentosus]|nr:hypothetical protein C8R48DRAFT_723482 [Suillus tomentosus]
MLVLQCSNEFRQLWGEGFRLCLPPLIQFLVLPPLLALATRQAQCHSFQHPFSPNHWPIRTREPLRFATISTHVHFAIYSEIIPSLPLQGTAEVT